ncbi:exopolysaccharide production repressor protein [Mesorhizobium sp. J8]|uniref:exopolysaccharide production repressor protein n=1 Tax=Mesorhizobium sp. J8 TaxID=2777475 RepID=UPI001CD88B78|nr:exopolysaccharide production repressor protein [Mesorhizobium sp. J8]
MAHAKTIWSYSSKTPLNQPRVRQAKDGIEQMAAARFVSGIIGTLAVFAIATYCLTGSFTAVFVQAGLCVLLMQVAYSLAVVYLVWKQGLGALGAQNPNTLLRQLDTSLDRRVGRACAELRADGQYEGEPSPCAELAHDNTVAAVEPEDSHSIMMSAASPSI